MIHGVLRSMSTLVNFVVLKYYINKVELDWSGWDEPSLSRLIKTEARTQWSSLHLETESNTTWPRNEVTKKNTCFTSILLFIAQHKTILWVGFLFFFSFLTTYTMYSHNTPYSYKERETEQKHFFSFFFFFLHTASLTWKIKNQEQSSNLTECSCQLCWFTFFFFLFLLFNFMGQGPSLYPKFQVFVKLGLWAIHS